MILSAVASARYSIELVSKLYISCFEPYFEPYFLRIQYTNISSVIRASVRTGY
jgi:hypothetical protein